MTTDYYQFPLTQRRRMLADEGFARNDLRIWQHNDGRAIGEGVAAALTDAAFHRFLNSAAPAEEKTRDGQPTEAVHL